MSRRSTIEINHDFESVIDTAPVDFAPVFYVAYAACSTQASTRAIAIEGCHQQICVAEN